MQRTGQPPDSTTDSADENDREDLRTSSTFAETVVSVAQRAFRRALIWEGSLVRAVFRTLGALVLLAALTAATEQYIQILSPPSPLGYVIKTSSWVLLTFVCVYGPLRIIVYRVGRDLSRLREWFRAL